MLKDILFIEDDIEIQALVKKKLSNKFELFMANNLKDALEKIKEKPFDAICLDIGLPDGSGLEFINYLKSDKAISKTPVLFITSEKGLDEKLKAFQLGASDYITKPFEPLELEARIEARIQLNQMPDSEFIKGDLFFKINSQSVSFLPNGQELETAQALDFSPTEFKLLYFMANRENEIFSREDLIKTVWSDNTHVLDRTIDQHISKIRKKIKASKYTIKAAHKLGYRFLLEG